jgi:diguanylate cyclase (GGDEF)-like protein
VNERDVLEGSRNEVDTLMVDESRRGARLVLPFLLPTVFLNWFILGEATHATSVRAAFAACLATILVRWAVLSKLSRPEASAASANRRLSRAHAFTASAWLVSAGFGAIYVTASPFTTSAQLLMVAMVATAICALGILSAASSLVSYVGYIAIHLMTLAAVIHTHHDASRMPTLPVMVTYFMVVLGIIAHRNNVSVREKTELSMQVREFGLRDALTGLRNRAFVEVFTEQRANQIVAQWQNQGRRKPAPGKSLALLIVDLDHFKKINDRHGHAIGDQVLSRFAKVAQSAVRAGDIVARWGGEEFLIVMEVDDRETAHVLAERVRVAVSKSPVTDKSGRSIDVTCSIGACLFPFDSTRAGDLTWQETMELADASLYRAKSKGRNCTMWAQPDTFFTPRQLLEHERENDAETLVTRKAA